MTEKDTKDEPIVQQLLDGKYIQEETETKTFRVLEAKGTGIFIRYTDKASEDASTHYDSLMKKSGAPKAEAYRHEWILNRIRAKGFKASDKVLIEVINALYAVFWDEKKAKFRKDLIESRIEEIEYTIIKTFKLLIHLRSAVWESKLEKWSLDFYPTKPKDARHRQDKARRAKGLFAVWMAKHIKPVKDQTCTPKEANAYQELLVRHVTTQIEDKHKVLVPQTELEVWIKHKDGYACVAKAEAEKVIAAKDDIILGRGDTIEDLNAHIKRLKARVRKNTSYALAFYKYNGDEGRWVRRPETK